MRTRVTRLMHTTDEVRELREIRATLENTLIENPKLKAYLEHSTIRRAAMAQIFNDISEDIARYLRK